MLDIKEIKKILPHRSPFLLIDRIIEIEPGKRAIGRKCVTYNEPFFAGHFEDERTYYRSISTGRSSNLLIDGRIYRQNSIFWRH